MLKCDDHLLLALRTVVDNAWEARNLMGGDGCVWGENIIATIVEMFDGKVIREKTDLMAAIETLRGYAPIEDCRDAVAHDGIAQTMRAVDVVSGKPNRYVLRALASNREPVFIEDDSDLKKFEGSSLAMGYVLTRVRTIELFLWANPLHTATKLGAWELR